MTETRENSEKAIQYLLGEISDAERDALEERLFADEEFSLFLDAAENDLIDEYARGEMDFSQKRRFEEKYLISPRRRDKARAAEILQAELLAEKQAVASAAPKVSFRQSLANIFRFPNLAWAGGLATVLLAILLVGWLLLRQTNAPQEIVKEENLNRAVDLPQTPPPQISPPVRNETNNNQPPPRPANNESKSPEEKSSPGKKEFDKSDPVSPSPPPPAPKPPPRFFAFTLFPAVRGGDRPVLNVPSATETVNLRVVHDNRQTFAKYRAEIRDANGGLIFSRDIPVTEKTLAKPLNINLQSDLLKDGSYELTLSGVAADGLAEEIKFYDFAVRRKKR